MPYIRKFNINTNFFVSVCVSLCRVIGSHLTRFHRATSFQYSASSEEEPKLIKSTYGWASSHQTLASSLIVLTNIRSTCSTLNVSQSPDRDTSWHIQVDSLGNGVSQTIFRFSSDSAVYGLFGLEGYSHPNSFPLAITWNRCNFHWRNRDVGGHTSQVAVA